MLSTREVARIMGRTERTITRWVREGRIAATKKGQSYFFTNDDVKVLYEGAFGKKAYYRINNKE